MDIVQYVKGLPIRTFHKGELLLSSGDDSDTFFAIREGFVKVASIDDDGRQKLLWLAGRYDVLPLERFFTHKVLQYDYVGFSEGSAYVMKKSDLHEIFQKDHAVAMEIAHGLSEHYDDLIERLSAVGQIDVKNKLLHMMYTMATKFSSTEVVDFHEIGLTITHQDLADMVGATREVVSIELSKLRDEGFIDYGRSRLTVNAWRIRHELNLLS